jgi:hypothetical protein
MFFVTATLIWLWSSRMLHFRLSLAVLFCCIWQKYLSVLIRIQIEDGCLLGCSAV